MRNLTDLVIEQIKEDIRNGDYTAIEELIQSIPEPKLIGFLPEGKYNV